MGGQKIRGGKKALYDKPLNKNMHFPSLALSPFFQLSWSSWKIVIFRVFFFIFWCKMSIVIWVIDHPQSQKVYHVYFKIN